MLSRRQLCMLVAAALCGGGCEDKPITVFVVRHAEKAKADAAAGPAGVKDPELTAAGKARAEALPEALGRVELTAVFSSPYKRTLETVAPVAKLHGLEVQTVDAADVEGLVARIKALDGGSAVLVAGHSNTVPMILEALGVSQKVELGHDDHGDLFVVTLGSKIRFERRRFGL